MIRRIQSGEITIAANATSGTATITSVVTANSFVVYNGFRTAVATADPGYQPFLTLTNSTTVTATNANANSSGAIIVSFTVYEFDSSSIVSIQTGSITWTNSSSGGTATISSVTTANSFVSYRGQTYSTTGTAFGLEGGNGILALTNSTTVTATNPTTNTGAIVIYFTVVQLASGILKSNQQITTTIAASATTQNTTISSVVTGNTLTIYNGQQFNAGQQNTSRLAYGFLAGSTTFTATRGATSTLTTALAVTLLEFNAGIVKSKQSGQTTIATLTASLSTTITSVVTPFSAVSWISMTDSALGDFSTGFQTIKLASATSVQQDRGASNALTTIGSWEAIEFFPPAWSATWSPSASFSVKGQSIDRSKATWNAVATFSAIGKGRSIARTTWTSSASFLPKGTSSAKNTATWSPHAVFAAVGKSLVKSKGAWSGSAIFNILGIAKIPSKATWSANASVTFGGVSRNVKSSKATWSGSAILLGASATTNKTVATWTASAAFSTSSSKLAQGVASWSPQATFLAGSMVYLGKIGYPFPTHHLLGDPFPKRIKLKHQRVRLQ